jgi:predicted patatin/cPLA2 family phospholipase
VKIKMLPLFITLAISHRAFGIQCMGLAIEGGGSKGAYQAGVLYEMANSPNNVNMDYNIVSGVSIGSVNAGLVTNYPIGQDKPMANNIVAFWNSINNNSDIYKEWPGGLIVGLLFERGLYNNEPAYELGKIWCSGPRQRNITCGSANLDTGLFDTFNESVGAAIVDAVIASSSVPFFFPSKTFEGYTWADGGGIINLDVESAIVRCMEMTGNQRDVIIDQLYDGYSTNLPSATSFKTLHVLERMYEIYSYDSAIWYSYNAMQAYPNVNYRYIVKPSEPMGGLLNFTRVNVQFNLNLGYKDGKTIFSQSQTRDNKDVIAEEVRMSKRIVFP